MDTIGNRIDQLGPGREVGAAVRHGRRRVRDSGAAAGRGRSGARQGDDRHRGGARDLRREGRSVPQPGSARWPSTAACCRSNTKLVTVDSARRRATASSGTWWARPRSSPAARCATRAPARTSSASGKPASPSRQDGGKRFGRYTEANIGNRLAVVLDNQIVSVATIQSKIEDSGRITGLGSEQEASICRATCVRVRCRPASSILEERSIGPSLGADSIHQGIVAGIAGLLAVIVVMLVYYKRAGVNAVLALVLNTVILMAALSYFHAVLTLPGIAGIILTIGMAVDSNVLIFERIREELRTGKSVIAAVDTGFGKAWWTIVDTHVTTVVSCAFLFLFGKGRCGVLR